MATALSSLAVAAAAVPESNVKDVITPVGDREA